VQRAVSPKFYLARGFIPWLYFSAKGGTKATMNEFDRLATQ
jgi:hypothetical protein